MTTDTIGPSGARSGLLAQGARLLGIALAVISLVVGVLAIVRSFNTGVNDSYVLLHLTALLLPASVQASLLNVSASPGLGRLLWWALDAPLFAWAGFLGILLLITFPSRSR